MVGPAIAARMKQRHQSPRHRIDSRQIWPLLPIASWTTKGQVVHAVILLMLRGDDVVDWKRRLISFLGQTTILAPIPRPRHNKSSCRRLKHSYLRRLA